MDAIHTYDQCLNGFYEFEKMIGCFKVFPEFIGVNEKGIIKVWAGDQWGNIGVVGGRIKQEEMVRSIVEAID